MKTGTARRAYSDHDNEAIRAARYDLIRVGLHGAVTSASPVSDVIQRSWRRSISNAAPVDPTQFRYLHTFDPESQLTRVALPVMDRLKDDLTDIDVALFLSDSSGQIVLRLVGNRTYRDSLDSAFAAEGFDFSEYAIGTNGLGTTIEERRPVLIRGSEHFNDALEGLACAGTPIRDPLTHRVAGSLSIACSADNGSPAMLALAIDAGRQIEERLIAARSIRDREMMASFSTRRQSSRDPLIIISQETVLANTAGLPFINADNHASLWELLNQQSVTDVSRVLELDVPYGRVSATVERIRTTDSSLAFALRITPQHLRVDARTSPASAPTSASASLTPFAYINERLRESTLASPVVAIAGPGGSGKSHTALALCSIHGEETQPLVLDPALFTTDRRRVPLSRAEAQLASGGCVVIRHVHEFLEADLPAIKALASLANQRDAAASRSGTAPNAVAARGPRLIFTLDPSACSGSLNNLLAEVAATVELPALCAISHRLPEVVRSMVSTMPSPLNAGNVSPPALQVLMRWNWAGNLAELNRTLAGIMQHKPGQVVLKEDLPLRFVANSRRRVLSPIEAAEQNAIVATLEQTGGNRSLAAGILGIGRTTLYRKMRALDLETKEELIP